MKRIFSIVISVLSFTMTIHAQSTLAKIEYAEAETDFQQGNYVESLEHIETVKDMLGSTNAKVMYLEVLALDNLKSFQETKIAEYHTAYFKSYKEAQNGQGWENRAAIKKKILEEFDQATALSIMLDNLGNISFKYYTEDFERIKLIYELSNTYITEFENNVPIEKLTEIYKVNQKLEPLAIKIDDIIKGSKSLDNYDFDSAFKFFKTACEAENKIGCDLLDETKVTKNNYEVAVKKKEELEAYNAKIVKLGGDDSVKLRGIERPMEQPIVKKPKTIIGLNDESIEIDGLQENIFINRHQYIVQKGDKYGIIDEYNQLVIPIEYDWLNPISLLDFRGHVISKKDGKVGILNHARDIVLDFIYDDAGPWANGWFWVEKDGKYGVVDSKNEVQVPIVYDFLGFRANEKRTKKIFVRIKKDGKWGWLKTNGDIHIEPTYDQTKADLYYKGKTTKVILDGVESTIEL